MTVIKLDELLLAHHEHERRAYQIEELLQVIWVVEKQLFEKIFKLILSDFQS